MNYRSICLNIARSLPLTLALFGTQPPLAQELVNATGNGTVQNPSLCSPTIGAGGNYTEGKLYLAGKCENGVVSPRIANEVNNKFLVFETSGAIGSGNDRAELAYTPMLPFNKTHTVRFRFRIPKGAPIHRSGQMFYAIQAWQCSPLSPIAGMRLVQGTSHNVDFIIRSENSRTPVIARQRLIPGQWHQIELVMRPARNATGSLIVRIDGKQIGNYQGAYGSDPQRCRPLRTSESWRAKFGIYKSNNPGTKYRVHFEDFKIIVGP